jgi:hypothetical protein
MNVNPYESPEGTNERPPRRTLTGWALVKDSALLLVVGLLASSWACRCSSRLSVFLLASSAGYWISSERRYHDAFPPVHADGEMKMRRDRRMSGRSVFSRS